MFPLLPTSILVEWKQSVYANGPRKEIKYTVEWYTQNEDNSWSQGHVDINTGTGLDSNNRLQAEIKQLKPSHIYHIKVTDTKINK